MAFRAEAQLFLLHQPLSPEALRQTAQMPFQEAEKALAATPIPFTFCAQPDVNFAVSEPLQVEGTTLQAVVFPTQAHVRVYDPEGDITDLNVHPADPSVEIFVRRGLDRLYVGTVSITSYPSLE